jgi:tight adherence protein C
MTLAAYRALIVIFAALVMGGFALFVAMRPTRLASRLGMRGLKRQRALLDPMWATVEPLVRWTGVRVSGVLAEKTREKLDKQLTYAGDVLGLTVDEYFGLLVLAGLLGAAAGGALSLYRDGLAPAIGVLALVGAAIPHVAVDNARAARFRAMNRGLPYAIDMMALSMSAGLDFPGAVQQVVNKAKTNGALRDELGYMLQQFHLGRTRAQVLKELSARAPIESVREFVQALLQAEERGTPVAGVLEIQAGTARVRRANLAEAAAADMKTKMVLPTMMIVGVNLLLIAIPSSMMIDRISGGLR